MLSWLRVKKHLALAVGGLTLIAHAMVYLSLAVIELDEVVVQRADLRNIMIPLTAGYAMAVLSYFFTDGAKPAEGDELKEVRSVGYVALAVLGPLLLITLTPLYTLLVNGTALFQEPNMTASGEASAYPNVVSESAKNAFLALAAASGAIQGLSVPALFGAPSPNDG